MKWSAQQDAALSAVSKWLQSSSRQIFRLFGYAGTGKTTLAQHLAEGVNNVRFAAYTGKAAHVLQQKGCPATTIHSLIYTPKGKSAERLRKMELAFSEMPIESERERALLIKRIEDEKKALRSPSFVLNLDSALLRTDLLIIDECSMVNEKMAGDLMHFGCKILVLGDPAQLPPVRGTGYFTEHKPDILLTEIHRQTSDNPIIEMATAVRCGKRLALGHYGSSLVTDEMTPEMALSADQILVGLNATRQAANRRVRELLGFSGQVPNPGERLVCLRNDAESGLLNGSIWNVMEVYDDGDPVEMAVSPDDDNCVQDVRAHRALFGGGEIDGWLRGEAQEFDFGYALTCHKSQGSEWDDVLIIDESSFFRQNARRHLYTAITRAAKRVTVKI